MGRTIIAIPTLGRTDKQITLSHLPERWLKDTYLVCIDTEESSLPHKSIVCPEQGNGVHRVRQWMMENIDADAIIQLDDDLSFRVRRSDGSFPFADKEEVGRAMDWLSESVLVRGFIQAGLGDPLFAQTKNEEEYCTKTTASSCFNVEQYRALGLRFDRIPFHEDVDVTLQIFGKGLPNVVSFAWCRVPPEMQEEGGCSIYRDLQNWNRASRFLKDSHPEYIREKFQEIPSCRSDAWKGTGLRATPSILMRKAYKDGCKRTGNQSILG